MIALRRVCVYGLAQYRSHLPAPASSLPCMPEYSIRLSSRNISSPDGLRPHEPRHMCCLVDSLQNLTLQFILPLIQQVYLTTAVHNLPFLIIVFRMVTASFLTEYLNINWIEGERWFHETLVDADVAINAMMWQNAGTKTCQRLRPRASLGPSSSFDLSFSFSPCLIEA